MLPVGKYYKTVMKTTWHRVRAQERNRAYVVAVLIAVASVAIQLRTGVIPGNTIVAVLAAAALPILAAACLMVFKEFLLAPVKIDTERDEQIRNLRDELEQKRSTSLDPYEASLLQQFQKAIVGLDPRKIELLKDIAANQPVNEFHLIQRFGDNVRNVHLHALETAGLIDHEMKTGESRLHWSIKKRYERMAQLYFFPSS